MATMNISLPDELKAYVEEQVAEGSYGTTSEVVRDLIRRERARTRLREAVLESLASGPGGQADEEFFSRLDRTAAGHHLP